MNEFKLSEEDKKRLESANISGNEIHVSVIREDGSTETVRLKILVECGCKSLLWSYTDYVKVDG